MVLEAFLLIYRMKYSCVKNKTTYRTRHLTGQCVSSLTLYYCDAGVPSIIMEFFVDARITPLPRHSHHPLWRGHPWWHYYHDYWLYSTTCAAPDWMHAFTNSTTTLSQCLYLQFVHWPFPCAVPNYVLKHHTGWTLAKCRTYWLYYEWSDNCIHTLTSCLRHCCDGKLSVRVWLKFMRKELVQLRTNSGSVNIQNVRVDAHNCGGIRSHLHRFHGLSLCFLL